MKKENKPKERKKKIKFDFSIASDAIVDGKFIISLGEKVVIERTRYDKKQVSICTFKGIESNGDVTMWDDTVSQFFSFNIKDPPLVKLKGNQEID